MKVRLKDDSLRFRLTRTEVAQLGAGTMVSSQTRLNALQSLNFRLIPSELAEVEVHTEQLTISVRLLADAAHNWATTDQVSLVDELAGLAVLIEKDFACLSPREGGDDDDCFVHPDEGELVC